MGYVYMKEHVCFVLLHTYLYLKRKGKKVKIFNYILFQLNPGLYLYVYGRRLCKRGGGVM